MSGQSIQARLAPLLDGLSDTQRRVAEAVLSDPESVAFGTLASVADAAETSTPTVIRLANQLGFDGFTELRDAVRAEVSGQLKTAAMRLRPPRRGPVIERVLEVELENVRSTIDGLDPAVLQQAFDLLVDGDRRIWVLANSQFAGLGARVADELALCRDRVTPLDGSPFRIATLLTRARTGDVLLSLDTQRHERWFVEVQRGAVASGLVPLALTDRLPCSLDLSGGVALTFGTEAAGPFDSHVGITTLLNLLIAGLVDHNQAGVRNRIERLEQRWVDDDLFDSE